MDVTDVYVSYGRGIFNFSCSGQWTVQKLTEAVRSEYNSDVSIHDKPRPPPSWIYQNVFENLDYGFVRTYRSYDMNEYDENELLANDTVLEVGCKVYLVSREKRKKG